MLSLNICSLMSKHQNLLSFINELTNKNINITVIALQEVWNVPYPELVTIPGFNLVFKQRKHTTGGGVAFYVKNEFTCKIVDHLSVFIEKEFECLTIATYINRNKILLSNIYRSLTPSNNLTQNDHADLFIDHLGTHLHNLSLLNQDSYVFTDSNINLLKLNYSQSVALYLETIYSNGFLQKVGKATRIAGQSYSLIDHILTKSQNQGDSSGTILSDISDHFINFIAIPTAKIKTKCEFRATRNFSKQNLENFRNNLRLCSWNHVVQCEDVNESYSLFWNDFNALYELFFPIKNVKLNKNIHKLNNFMTNGLLTSRQNKNELQKKALQDPTNYDSTYKSYRNLYNILIRKCKQKYLDDNFKKHERNSKKHGIF